MSALISFFGYVGLAYVGTKIAMLVWQLTRSPKNLASFGKWSVVTGATDGIGKAMALELAKQGQNVLIIGRNPEKLKNTVQFLRQGSKATVESLQMDLSLYSTDKALQEKYLESLKDKDVGILVNNAGLSYPYTNFFDEVEQQRVLSIMEVNNVASTLLSHQTIKAKLANKKQSAIVNVSSAGAVLPHPMHAVYSASKAFLNKMSQDLASEYSSKGISVQSQMPYFVVSNMSKIRKPSFTTPSAADYAVAAVKQIGYNGAISPFPVHAVMFFLFDLIPDFILTPLIFRMHAAIKKKGDLKYAKKK